MATPKNTFYQPEQVAKVAVALAVEDSYLGATINRDFEDDLLGGGGKGRTVNVRVPAALIARSRDIDEVDTAITLDKLTESTVSVKLGEHLYSAVPLTEGDITLDLTSFSRQVLAPQVAAVVDKVENEVSEALEAVEGVQTGEDAISYDAANPVKTFTAIRKLLRKRGVPQTGLNVVVGTNVYADLLDAKAITDAGESGSTAALRDGNVGRVRGFQIVESVRVDDDAIIAYHRDAFTLAVRAPKVPNGASFGASVSKGGYALRYLRDYDVSYTLDRSLVSTFAGVKSMPLYKVTRDYDASTVSVDEVAGGAAVQIDTAADAG